jgi:glycosyltransferase involved in cell wall biosynthesis
MVRNIFHAFRPKIGVFEQYNPRPLDLPVQKLDSNTIISWPTFSIVTPSYNQGQFIEKTIKSVINQDYPGQIEYVIQDGNSTDDSVSLIKKYASKLTFFESKKDKGQPNALNIGFSRTTGDFMGYINSDDIYFSSAFRIAATVFLNNPLIDVIYGHRTIIDKDDHEIGKWILPPFNKRVFCNLDYIPQETVFWRRRIWERVGGFIDENLQYAFDWDLFLRFALVGGTINRVPYYLSAFRFHHDQKTVKGLPNIQEEVESIRQKWGNPETILTNCERKLYFFSSMIFTCFESIKKNNKWICQLNRKKR